MGFDENRIYMTRSNIIENEVAVSLVDNGHSRVTLQVPCSEGNICTLQHQHVVFCISRNTSGLEGGLRPRSAQWRIADVKSKHQGIPVAVDLPRWLRWLRHSVHWPVRSIGGAGVQFPGSAGIFRVRISGAHALRLISQADKGHKEGSTVSSIICDHWLILA